MAGNITVRITRKWWRGAPEVGARVSAALAKLAMDWQAQAQGNIRAYGAIDTGAMLGSTQAVQQGAFSWLLTSPQHYSIYVDMGTYKMAGRPFFSNAWYLTADAFPKAMRAAVYF